MLDDAVRDERFYPFKSTQEPVKHVSIALLTNREIVRFVCEWIVVLFVAWYFISALRVMTDGQKKYLRINIQ